MELPSPVVALTSIKVVDEANEKFSHNMRNLLLAVGVWNDSLLRLLLGCWRVDVAVGADDIALVGAVFDLVSVREAWVLVFLIHQCFYFSIIS